MDKYNKIDYLGEGAYGNVYKVRCKETGQIYALKRFKTNVSGTTVREVSCLAALNFHPYVIRMFTCVPDGNRMTALLEYAPYTLSDFILQRETRIVSDDLLRMMVPVSFVGQFSKQISSALDCMHKLNIVHRDLRPCNVLLTQDLTVKVADFGLSRQSADRMSPGLTAAEYMAPELSVYDVKPVQYTCAVDMWSLGVIIVYAMEGRPLFQEQWIGTKFFSRQKMIATVLGLDNPDDAPKMMPNVTMHPQIKNVVLKLLVVTVSERLQARELNSDPWIRTVEMTEEEKVRIKSYLEE